MSELRRISVAVEIIQLASHAASLTITVLNAYLRHPGALPDNLLTTAQSDRESFIAAVELAYAGKRLLARQNPMRAPAAVPGMLVEHGATPASAVARYNSSQPTVQGDLTDHCRAPGRAAAVAA